MTHPIVASDPGMKNFEDEKTKLDEAQRRHLERRRVNEETNSDLRVEHDAARARAGLSGDAAPPEPEYQSEDIAEALHQLLTNRDDLRARRKELLAALVGEGAGEDLLDREFEIQEKLSRLPVTEWDSLLSEYRQLHETARELATAWDSIHPGWSDTLPRPSLKALIRREPATDTEIFNLIRSKSSMSLLGLDQELDPGNNPRPMSGDPEQGRMDPRKVRALRLDTLDRAEI